MTVPVELDEQYLLEAQDVNDPVWETDAIIDNMQRVDDPNDQYDTRQPAASIRTASGVLDFLDGVRETVLADVMPKAAETPKKKPKLDTVATKEVASDKWRGSNFTVGVSPVQIAVESSERRRITIRQRTINPVIGNGHAYLSSISSTANAPNTILLEFNAFYISEVTLYTKDNVWAICAAGDGAILDVVEEFDMES